MGVAVRAAAAMGALLAGALLTAWLERRLLARRQELGPAIAVEAGRELRLHHPDRWMYPAGPLVALFGVVLAAVVIPYDQNLVGADLGIGFFYFIVVVDYVVLGIAIGGWGANTRNAVEVYYRIVAQLVAYVVPLGLAYIGAIMMGRSLSTVAIVEAQSGLWFIVLQPLGFALYVVTGLMQAYRAPFLEPFARRIDGGVIGAYGGWMAVLWRLALSGVLFVVAAAAAVLYLGGWRGPLLPGPVWMLLKTFAVMALMVWLGTRVRLLSVAEMLALSWKILIPVGLLNVLIVGVEILFGVGPS
jgi:NADH-quinone oxidoreductase subunit H